MPMLEDLLPIAIDMTASLTAKDRMERIVRAVSRAIPCDAATLLRVEGERLVPVAAIGLSPDLMGRSFLRSEHPRLDVICSSEEPTLFPADSDLPDPFDGLVDQSPHLTVHSCLGCPLRVENELVGVITADALKPGSFDALPAQFLQQLAILAAAALRTSDLISALEYQSHHHGMVAADLVKESLESRGGLLIGESPTMARLNREIEVVASSDFPVLVTGETGTGKELVVRTLHAMSSRASKPLVYVNCAALPEAIVESELFGHKRGAFTGAEENRPGKFRVAHEASLLLDEIGELPLHMQPKLLRVLQEGEVQAIGADTPTHVDVRILAATNRDLESEVKAGRFRADLLHRLDVCRIEVPPLRSHKEDIPQLMGHFADRARRKLGTGPILFSPEAPAELLRREWPGNVRELENTLARAILRASARTSNMDSVIVNHSDLQDHSALAASTEQAQVPTAQQPQQTLRESTQSHQRLRIQQTVEACGGNWAAAARKLGLHRSNLYHLAQRLGLRK